MPQGQTLFIINPAAGGGASLAKWETMRKDFFTLYHPASEVYTTGKGDGAVRAQHALRDGCGMIVAVGGDGTLNEVINGIVGSDGAVPHGLRLGYIGLGSSNDLLRTLGLSKSADLLGREVQMDVCRLTYTSFEGRPESRHFLLNSSIGVVSKAVALFNRPTRIRRALRRINADFAVLCAGLSAIVAPPRFRCDIQVDTEEPVHAEVSNLAIVKSPHVGGGMDYGTPSALDDGRFCLLGFKPMTAVEMTRLLPKMYDGTIARHRKAWTRFATQVKITASNAPPIEADGELLGVPPVTYEIFPRALRILV